MKLAPRDWVIDCDHNYWSRRLRFAAWPDTNWRDVAGAVAQGTFTGTTRAINQGGIATSLAATLDRIDYTVSETQLLGYGNQCSIVFTYKNTAATSQYKRLFEGTTALNFILIIDTFSSIVTLYGPDITTNLWNFASTAFTPLMDGQVHVAILHVDWNVGGAATIWVDGSRTVGTLSGAAMAKPVLTTWSIGSSVATREPDGEIGCMFFFDTYVPVNVFTVDPFYAVRPLPRIVGKAPAAVTNFMAASDYRDSSFQQRADLEVVTY